MSERQAIEAASATYRRCARLLAEAADTELPDGMGLGQRALFELTIEIALPSMAVRLRDEEGLVEDALTEDDFSMNAILRALRLAARDVETDGEGVAERDALIRSANIRLQKEGLKPVRLQRDLGRYSWIAEHMHVFLRRHADVVERVPGRQAHLRVLPRKAKKSKVKSG